MRRTVLMLAVIGLLLGQAVRSFGVDAAGCDQACADDGPLGCSGEEGCCSCCFYPRTILPAGAAASGLAPTWSHVPQEGGATPLPVPREILHVPKPSLS